MLHRLGWALSGAMAVVAVLALARATTAGPLDPPGPVGSTLKSLALIPGSWALLLPSNDGEIDGCNSSRFKCVLANQAVLDAETGLVWERDIDTTEFNWHAANAGCQQASIGLRHGWRMPSFEEVASLFEISFPATHPFTGLAFDTNYWTATTQDGSTGQAVVIIIPPVGGSARITLDKGTDGPRRWCVRGGAGYTGGQTDPVP